jgi:hypothetical protein
MDYSFDPKYRIGYVRFQGKDTPVSYSQDYDFDGLTLVVDFDSDDEVVGVEFF